MITYLKNYLSITKKEWNGLVILFVLMLLAFAAPYVDHRLYKDSIINAKDINTGVAELNRHKYKPAFTYAKKMTSNSVVYSRKPHITTPLELNTADSAALTTIYGVGPAFAHRIIKYRDRLGGFYNKVQLKEVYGLDDDKYDELSDQVRVDPSHLQKVAVNAADFDDLKRFPYLSFKQMNAIIQYRLQHGNYASAADLRDIAILDEQTINKIKPYLSFK